MADYDKAVVDLAPGKTFEQEVGLFGYDMEQAGQVHRQCPVPLVQRPPRLRGRKPAAWTRGPIWTGVVSTATIEITVGGAAGVGAEPANLSQGVQGTVTKLSGNFMPGPGPGRCPGHLPAGGSRSTSSAAR